MGRVRLRAPGPTGRLLASRCRRGRRLQIQALGILVVLTGGLAGTPCASADGLDEAVPDSALLFVSVRDVPALRDRCTQLPLYRLFHEPSVQVFLDGPLEEARQGLREVEGDLEGIASRFIDCLTGEVALVVTASGPNLGAEPDFLVIATTAGKREQAESVLDLILRKSSAEGREERRHDFAGVTIVELVAPEVPSEGAESWSQCLTDQYLLVGSSLPLMKEVLMGLLREPSGALAAQPDYRATRRGLGRDADLVAYVNVAALRAMWETDLGADGPDTRVEEVLRVLGLDEVRAIGLAAGARDEGLWLAGYVCPASQGGLFGLLPGVSGAHEPPGWVPADALSYAWVGLDFARAWQLVNDILRTVSPPEYMTFRNSLVVPDPSGGPALDVERDLVTPLGEGVWVCLRLRDDALQDLWSEGAQGRTPTPSRDCWEVTQALSLKDGPALARTVERLRVQGLPPFSLLKPVDFQGRRLYTLDLTLDTPFSWPHPDEAEPPPAPAEPLALGFMSGATEGDALVVAPGLQALQDLVLRASASSPGLGAQERFARAVSTIPARSRVCFVVYNDLHGHVRSVGEFARRHGTLPPWTTFGPSVLLNLFDLQADLFPPDEDLLPYLDGSVCFATKDDEGVLLQLLIVAPPDGGT